jgi:cytochrome c oxidase subunit II
MRNGFPPLPRGTHRLVVTPPRRPPLAIPVALGGALLAAGCGGDENVLRPGSPEQDRIAALAWIMAIGCAVALGIAAFFLLLGWVRRNRVGLPGGGGDQAGAVLVVVLGVAVPIVVLSALFWYANVDVMRTTAAPAAGSTALTVEVTGHQWFWEVRYPGTGAVTANELHIPAGTRVNLVVRTADVIHSFWVPRLNRKVDMIPGRANRILLFAERPGVYPGRCAEFCGLQHAHMQLLVVAEPPGAFRRWLRELAEPATTPDAAAAQRGRELFLDGACAGCHTIRGTEARGTVGPDLTHLQSRSTLAAGTIPNRPPTLRDWVRDPQHLKPGTRMPRLELSERELDDLVAYLETLR